MKYENKKTCGECKHMSVDCLYCKNHLSTLASRDQVSPFCGEWEPKTNGDKFRQMSNKELAKLIVPKVMFCDGCPVKCAEKDIPLCENDPFGVDVIENVCIKRVEAWLNAPADVCVKQNGNDDTQTDLCKVEDTESEGGIE
jgi:hypothetical protein